MNFKKKLFILFAITIFTNNSNCMFTSQYSEFGGNSLEKYNQEKQGLLNLPLNLKEFDWRNLKHLKILKDLYNDNLKMIIIIACGCREMFPIEDKTTIELESGQRFIKLCKKDKYGRIVYENGKLIFIDYLVKEIDPLFKNFINKSILLIEYTMPLLSNNDEIQKYYDTIRLTPEIPSLLDQDPSQIRANNNLTTRKSRIVSRPGQPTIHITNVNEKFIECLNKLEITLKFMANYIENNPRINSKNILLNIVKNLLEQINNFFTEYEEKTGGTARRN